MHCERKVIQAGNDVRNRSYFIYACNVCGHSQDFNAVTNFDSDRLRKCSNCGVTDDTNDREYLIKQQQKLEQQVKELQVELGKRSLELSTIIEKLSSMQDPERILV